MPVLPVNASFDEIQKYVAETELERGFADQSIL